MKNQNRKCQKALLPFLLAFLLLASAIAALSAVPGMTVEASTAKFSYARSASAKTASADASSAETEAAADGSDTEAGTGKLWSEEYYRAVDTTGGLSDAEIRSLDTACLEFMQTYGADLSVLAVTSDKYEGATLEELAGGYYDSCGFGYGENRDGFQMVWDTETDEIKIAAFGSAADLIPDSYLKYVEENAPQFTEKYGHYGPMYATTRYLSNYLRGSGDTAAGTAAADGSEAAADAGENGAAERAQAADKKDDEGANGAVAVDAASQESAASSGQGAETGEDAAEGATAAAAVLSEDVQATKSADSLNSLTGDGAVGRLLPDGQFPDDSLRVGEGADMPSWYPKDPGTFPFYHDETAPRVVDIADIFTDEEEAQMEARLAGIREQVGKDIVVWTDVSTYGLSRSVYAADVYDFNGYGIGDDREGVCLMISMEPGNRGWWCCCTGPVTMGLYTETIANQIDDLLYEYMRAGDYGTGVIDWIENFRRLYVTGSPYNEEWALASKETFQRFHDDDAPRVVDDAGILTDSEIEQLRAQAAQISEQYGVDVVVHTALNQGILDRDEYADLFYITHGYGFGDNYDGIQLTIFKRPNYSGGVRVTASGKGLDKLTAVNKNRLEDRCEDIVLGRKYYEAASQWLSQTEHMLRTGRAPRSSGSWSFATAIELLAGLLFGGVSLGRAKAGMATPRVKENADAYVVPKSLRLRKVKDTFLHSDVTRRYSPPPKQSSSGGSSSGGHSSYSSSYSGSSGSSHSGSGRSF